MQTRELVAHGAFPPDRVRQVTSACGIVGGWLQLGWVVCPSASLILPDKTEAGRASDLWKTTCLELFVKTRGASAYSECNFALSGQWAAYDFCNWREGMADRPLSHDPIITVDNGSEAMVCKVALPLSDLPDLPADIALTCVLEEQGGAISYWAAAHASPDKPDFHDASCFGFSLGPPHAL